MTADRADGRRRRRATVMAAPVVRADLTNTVQVSGSLGYAGSYTIVNQAQGTAYTGLPAVGTTIRRGQQLYAVDGAPITLFYGGTPEWRALFAGVTPGRDVAQLNRNLMALGYGAGLSPDAEPPAPPQLIQAGVRAAECMRAHGLVNDRDPTAQTPYTPGHGFGLDSSEVPAGGKASPVFQGAAHACRSLLDAEIRASALGSLGNDG